MNYQECPSCSFKAKTKEELEAHYDEKHARLKPEYDGGCGGGC